MCLYQSRPDVKANYTPKRLHAIVHEIPLFYRSTLAFRHRLTQKLTQLISVGSQNPTGNTKGTCFVGCGGISLDLQLAKNQRDGPQTVGCRQPYFTL